MFQSLLLEIILKTTKHVNTQSSILAPEAFTGTLRHQKHSAIQPTDPATHSVTGTVCEVISRPTPELLLDKPDRGSPSTAPALPLFCLSLHSIKVWKLMKVQLHRAAVGSLRAGSGNWKSEEARNSGRTRFIQADFRSHRLCSFKKDQVPGQRPA